MSKDMCRIKFRNRVRAAIDAIDMGNLVDVKDADGERVGCSGIIVDTKTGISIQVVTDANIPYILCERYGRKNRLRYSVPERYLPLVAAEVFKQERCVMAGTQSRKRLPNPAKAVMEHKCSAASMAAKPQGGDSRSRHATKTCGAVLPRMDKHDPYRGIARNKVAGRYFAAGFESIMYWKNGSRIKGQPTWYLRVVNTRTANIISDDWLGKNEAVDWLIKHFGCHRCNTMLSKAAGHAVPTKRPCFSASRRNAVAAQNLIGELLPENIGPDITAGTLGIDLYERITSGM